MGDETPEVRRVRDAAERERGALALLDQLDDGERGFLAGALLVACGDEAGALIPRLNLDSADPSLMSRSDVARLLAHMQAQGGEALGRARQALRTGDMPPALLDDLFAPSRGNSDTSRLGDDPV